MNKHVRHALVVLLAVVVGLSMLSFLVPAIIATPAAVPQPEATTATTPAFTGGTVTNVTTTPAPSTPTGTN